MQIFRFNVLINDLYNLNRIHNRIHFCLLKCKQKES